MLEIGLKGRREATVTADITAEAVGSGSLPVYATPMMIALVEATAAGSVQPHLDEGSSTVGTLVNVSHTSATPVGMKVVCETELVEIDRRRLVFKVEVSDEAGPIGSGMHERFVVDDAKFMSKAGSKLESSHGSRCWHSFFSILYRPFGNPTIMLYISRSIQYRPSKTRRIGRRWVAINAYGQRILFLIPVRLYRLPLHTWL